MSCYFGHKWGPWEYRGNIERVDRYDKLTRVFQMQRRQCRRCGFIEQCDIGLAPMVAKP